MSATPANPRVSRVSKFSLVWFVPVLALAVGGWLVYNELRLRGPEITIEFADGSGLEANKTPLEYKGITIGTVKEVELNPDHTGVIVHLRIDKDVADLATADAQFWVVRPEIGFSGVRGLDLLLSGAKIAVLPGKGAPATKFRGLDKTPPSENTNEGRAFILESDALGSLNPGAPVYFREFKVGVVETSRLASNSAAVLIRIRVFTPYIDLVRTDTRFWNAGGASLKINLLGAQVKTTSLESIFSGGVAFATPDEKQLAPAASDGATFKLYPDSEKEWLKWHPSIPIQSGEASPEPSAPTNPVPRPSL